MSGRSQEHREENLTAEISVSPNSEVLVSELSTTDSNSGESKSSPSEEVYENVDGVYSTEIASVNVSTQESLNKKSADSDLTDLNVSSKSDILKTSSETPPISEFKTSERVLPSSGSTVKENTSHSNISVSPNQQVIHPANGTGAHVNENLDSKKKENTIKVQVSQTSPPTVIAQCQQVSVGWDSFRTRALVVLFVGFILWASIFFPLLHNELI